MMTLKTTWKTMNQLMTVASASLMIPKKRKKSLKTLLLRFLTRGSIFYFDIFEIARHDLMLHLNYYYFACAFNII